VGFLALDEDRFCLPAFLVSDSM
jgi:hypothetical protein